MKRAYIYPAGKKNYSSNPYVSDFVNSLSSCICFVNRTRVSNFGILDLFVYIRKIDIVFLNWIEDLPDRKLGLIQSLLFILAVSILKLKKIAIFFTLHNKESHYKTRNSSKKLLRKFILRNADYILIHSKEGFKVLDEYRGIKAYNIYLPHPFRDSLSLTVNPEKKFDLLIWGSIRPYKGIDVFLQYLHERGLQNSYKTLIIGHVYPVEYENELKKYCTESINLTNVYVPTDKLNELIDQSKIILFTYNENSVISSGALIYSLQRGAVIIGPNIGAFKDASEEGIIEVYETFEDLIAKIDCLLRSSFKKKDQVEKYIKENSWKKFGEKIISTICSH